MLQRTLLEPFFIFNRESTGALSQNSVVGRVGCVWGRIKGKKMEAVSHINETFKRHINKVKRLSGLALQNIYISTSERTAQPVSGLWGIFMFPVFSFN